MNFDASVDAGADTVCEWCILNQCIPFKRQRESQHWNSVWMDTIQSNYTATELVSHVRIRCLQLTLKGLLIATDIARALNMVGNMALSYWIVSLIQ